MKEIKKSASFTSKQKGKDVKFNIDLNYSPEYDSFIIKVKEGEGFMSYSSNIERMPLKVIQKLNEMLEEVLVQAGSEYEMKEHKMFDGGKVDSKLTENEVEKIAKETAKALGSKFSVTEGTIDNGSFDLDYDGVKYDGGSYIVLEDGDVKNVAMPKKPIVYNYKTKKKYEFGGDFQSGVYNRGGAVKNERLHVNKDEDYEVRYSKPRPYRKGYKGLRNFDGGGSVGNEQNLKRRLKFINEDAERIFKNAPKSFLEYPVKDWDSIGTLLSNIEIASNIKDNESDDWKSIKFSGLNSTEKLERRLKFISEDAERIFKYSPKEFLDYPVKDWNSLGTLLSNIKIASNLKDDESDNWKFDEGGEMDLTDDKRLRLRKPVMPERKYSKKEWAEKYNPRAYEFMGKDKMATGGEVKLSDLKVESGMGAGKKTWEVSYPKIQGKGVYFQDQYTKEEAKKHWLENVASKYKFATGGGVGLVGNQKRIDMNKNGKIDAEDFKILRSSMNGAWRNERKHVNHNEDYEVRYARKKTDRTGYKGKRKFAEGGGVEKIKEGDKVVYKDNVYLLSKIEKRYVGGLYDVQYHLISYKINLPNVMVDDVRFIKKFEGGGGISKFKMLSDKVARNYEGKRVKPQYQKEYGKVYSKEEAKEVGNKVAGKVKSMQKAESGTETKKGGKGAIMILAKKIRKDGEKWTDAVKRAGQQLK